ncbi:MULTISPECIES: phage tail assembly chaperone family protein, TAC [Stenotrophomonas]|uniref:phage tail assembly chaperone family protein, TAC n=1 Tax=Stenotrophomonas TaxID=40323 RepID=UPI000B763E37|nr:MULTISPECIES: phage tail assembly chaperone family protein, TAC [Stenotrophomonas]SMR69248.1 Phage tail assembly chaperone, TAC [Stenotrophomonas sp. yr243]SNT58103.1 Phage tail assembly chaperone, TAC [Stenotrophomonas lactitubi]
MTETTNTAEPLLDPSLFISEDVHRREVKLADGRKHTFYIREQDAGVLRAFFAGQASDDSDKQADSMARLIAKAICDPEGKQALSLVDAKRLKFAVQIALTKAISEVHSYQGKESLPAEEAESGSDTSSL